MLLHKLMLFGIETQMGLPYKLESQSLNESKLSSNSE